MEGRSTEQDPAGRPSAEQIARSIVDTSRYLVLATADGDGRPWSTPVYFAHVGYRELLWVSSPEALHSRNIGVRAEVGIAIFDSSAPIGTGQGVYVSALAVEVTGEGLDDGIEVFSQRSIGHGGPAWSPVDVQGDSGLRLYRATAEAHSILAKDGQPDHRIPVHIAASG